MTKSKIRKLLSVLLCLAAAILLAVGALHLPKQNNETGQAILSGLRIQTLLNATGESLVESYVEIAKEEARTRVKEAGGGMEEIREAVAAAEEEARATYTNAETDLTGVDTAALSLAVAAYTEALKAYVEIEAAAMAAYEEEHYDEAAQALAEKHQEMAEAGEEIPEDDAVVVDMSGFTATPEMLEADSLVAAAYDRISGELKAIYPILDDEALNTLEGIIKEIIYQAGDDFSSLYDRYLEASGASAEAGNFLIRHADDLMYLAAALALLALLLLFYEWLVEKLGIPRVIIGLFFLLLCFLALWYDLDLAALLNNSIVRMGMNSIMVLAMVPGIQCGISLNLGLPIGLVCGLVGGLLTIELGIPGMAGFFFAILVGVVIAALSGFLYGKLLNRLKGEEMSITTYVGFSIVSVMCIAWLALPFQSLKLRWPLGTGLRNTIGLDSTNFKHVLDDFLAFDIGSFTVPTGLLLFMALCCLLAWFFSRSRTGQAMLAAGNNPRFAQAVGIDVDKMRIIGTALSTALGAVGILVYSQSYGFMQLYTAPRQMGFVAASAILIGGASTIRCKVSHVIIGTFLFQGVLTLGMPVANVLVPGSSISETLRILISNGIILYALTKSGGDSRG